MAKYALSYAVDKYRLTLHLCRSLSLCVKKEVDELRIINDYLPAY